MARLLFELWRLRRAQRVDPATAARLPPGQTLTRKWPVLTHGSTPVADLRRWTFRCFGRVEEEVTWTWAEFARLPRVRITSDVHCVTRWSKLDNEWEGVSVREIMSRVRLRPEVRYVMVHADPDYTTNLALEDLVDDDVLLAFRHNGRDLEPDHGYPCRLVVPKRYFWKSAKWLRGLQFLANDRPGFWERYGYHNDADPWLEQRYSDE
jgi:DMSO/TMAO reductase YedYZ molybdopterin-dependent catalytic subunit